VFSLPIIYLAIRGMIGAGLPRPEDYGRRAP
jgi:hypothetical protein